MRPRCACPRECPCRDSKVGPCPALITLDNEERFEGCEGQPPEDNYFPGIYPEDE